MWKDSGFGLNRSVREIAAVPLHALRPLRVEMVVPALARAGMETMATGLAIALAKRNHSVGITCLDEEGPLADMARACGVHVSVVQCPGLTPLLAPDRNLVGHFRERSPDIVHTHSGSWAKAAVAARAAGVPRILHTAHGFVHKEPWFNAAIDAWAARHTDHVVTVSESIRSYVLKKTHLQTDRVETIINGVDVNRFCPGARTNQFRGEFSIPENAHLIICVARLDPIKNHSLLLRAFAQLDDKSSYLALVGDGPLAQDLKREAKELAIQNRVIFAGVQTDAAPIYKESDLFVLSSHSEGSSISVLEALSSGVPVVATDVGGNSELLAQGRCGILVEPGSVHGLADAMNGLLKSSKRRLHFAEAGRARVLECFDEAKVVDAYEARYRQGFLHRN